MVREKKWLVEFSRSVVFEDFLTWSYYGQVQRFRSHSSCPEYAFKMSIWGEEFFLSGIGNGCREKGGQRGDAASREFERI
jgi:hypothetical protein